MQDTDHPDRVTHPYRYVGSIASSADASWHDAKAHARWQHIGASISRQFGLRGLFGIDAVVTGRGEFSEITPIEVNPRYTASVELLERATGFAAIARHCDAFAGRECDKGSIWRALRPFLGKLVVYSPATFVIDRAFEQRIDEMNRDVDYPMITDIPWPGTSVQSGEPVVTIHAAAESLEELARQLGLWGWGGPGARLHDAIRQSASA
jgi:predicted ATP-grasp superfamily ATP-dependent carboligase